MVPPQLRKNKVIFVVLVTFGILMIFLLNEISRRDAVVQKLETQLAQIRHGGVRGLSSGENEYVEHFTDESTILIYNRVPKTGSTSFAGIAYELCYKNNYHVLHVNTTANAHTLSVADQMHFIQNVTEWTLHKPAMYHGHFYYIDFDKLGYSNRRPLYINIIRKPLDRLLSYYYFVRFGDNFRPHLIRRKQGNQMTFDECVELKLKECDPVHLWLQIPFFCGHAYRCRQPGSRWALEQAKFNLVHNYLLVGITEELGDFIAMLEVMLPQFFNGAMDIYMNSEKSHLRKTNKKEMPSEETVSKIQQSTIWRMENEFYEFARDQFKFQRTLTFRLLEPDDGGGVIDKPSVNSAGIRQTYLLSDGQLYEPKGLQYHYEKIRPR